MGTYLAGVAVSSTLAFAIVDATVGDISRSTWPVVERLWAAGAILAALLVVDAVRVWSGKRSSFGCSRQTPYDWKRHGLKGILGWGLDTGLPFTTVRATPLPLFGLLMVALGFGSAFLGLAYAGGIAAGLAGSIVPFTARETTTFPNSSAFQLIDQRRIALGPQRLVLAPYALAIGLVTLAVTSGQ